MMGSRHSRARRAARAHETAVVRRPPAGRTAIGRTIVHLPSRFRVAVAVWLAPALATLLARWALSSDPAAADVQRLGYGVPALQDGR